MKEVSGSDLDDDYDEEYDSSEVDINSEDAETESNIDDGLLDAVFDELPGTTTKTLKLNVLTFHSNFHFRNWTDQTSSPSTSPNKAFPPSGTKLNLPPARRWRVLLLHHGRSVSIRHQHISHSGYIDDILHVM